MFLFYHLAPPQFKIQYRNQTARRGEDAVLECEAEGETPIGILWSKDNANIDPNAEVRLEKALNLNLSTLIPNLNICSSRGNYM